MSQTQLLGTVWTACLTWKPLASLAEKLCAGAVLCHRGCTIEAELWRLSCGGWVMVCCGRRSAPLLVLYLVGHPSTPTVTTKRAFRHCQLSPEGKPTLAESWVGTWDNEHWPPSRRHSPMWVLPSALFAPLQRLPRWTQTRHACLHSASTPTRVLTFPIKLGSCYSLATF